MQLEPSKFSYFDPTYYSDLRTSFWVRNNGNLNFSILTSLYQVMVLLPRSAQLDLVGSVRPVQVN